MPQDPRIFRFTGYKTPAVTYYGAVQRDPTVGVSGAKPRFKPAREEMPELSRAYLQIRNESQRAKMLAAQMALAKARGELIERRLVEAQAAYLLICLRQRILELPAACAPRLAGLNDEHAIREVLKSAVLALLEEIKDLPAKVTDEDWFSKVAGDGEPPPGPPASPAQLKRAGERAEVRRQKQTAATARRRAAQL